MNLKADINWIKAELENVNDPVLIDTFKKLLQKRREVQDDGARKMYLEGLEDLQTGNTISHEALLEEVENWGKEVSIQFT